MTWFTQQKDCNHLLGMGCSMGGPEEELDLFDLESKVDSFELDSDGLPSSPNIEFVSYCARCGKNIDKIVLKLLKNYVWRYGMRGR